MNFIHFIKIILILLFVTFLFIFAFRFKAKPTSDSLHLLTMKELDDYVQVDSHLKPLRGSLQLTFFQLLKQKKIKQAKLNDLKYFLLLSLEELNHVFNQYKENKIPISNHEMFYTHFLDYINQAKGELILNASMFNSYPFIKNMSSLVYQKHKYAMKEVKIKQGFNLERLDFHTYLNRLGLFLSNFKNTSSNSKFISSYEKKNSFDLTSQRDFKRALVFTWKLGSFICSKLQKNESVINEMIIFDKYFLHIFNLCSRAKQNGFPFGYDWFLFASHYPTILSYKLYLDFKTKKVIKLLYIKEIFKFLPQPNYSRHIRRYKSNVAVMSVSYIIAQLFQNYRTMNNFYSFLSDFLNGNVYHNEVIINFQEPRNNKFEDGLYVDGGFIIHQNLVSYNYLTAYLYPSLFFKLMFNEETNNIDKIFHTLNRFVLPNGKVNPVIVSRYGKFDEIKNVLDEFISHSKDVYQSNEMREYEKKRNNIHPIKKGIRVIESARVVLATFSTWSIQLKINSELAYGEVDIFNKQILKQISMSKIMLFDNSLLSEFESHSLYPGVMSYKEFLDQSETFSIKYGTNTFTFQKANYTFNQIDQNTIFIYSHVVNKEIKKEYEELILLTEFGLIVGYFNIKKELESDLYVTVTSPLIDRQTNTFILYSDDESELQTHKYATIKKINKHILYSNLIKGSPLVRAEVKISDKIEISIKMNKTFNFLLDKTSGAYFYKN